MFWHFDMLCIGILITSYFRLQIKLLIYLGDTYFTVLSLDVSVG